MHWDLDPPPQDRLHPRSHGRMSLVRQDIFDLDRRRSSPQSLEVDEVDTAVTVDVYRREFGRQELPDLWRCSLKMHSYGEGRVYVQTDCIFPPRHEEKLQQALRRNVSSGPQMQAWHNLVTSRNCARAFCRHCSRTSTRACSGKSRRGFKQLQGAVGCGCSLSEPSLSCTLVEHGRAEPLRNPRRPGAVGCPPISQVELRLATVKTTRLELSCPPH